MAARLLHRGDVVRRPDGGYTVRRERPRPDVERTAQARQRAIVAP